MTERLLPIVWKMNCWLRTYGKAGGFLIQLLNILWPGTTIFQITLSTSTSREARLLIPVDHCNFYCLPAVCPWLLSSGVLSEEQNNQEASFPNLCGKYLRERQPPELISYVGSPSCCFWSWWALPSTTEGPYRYYPMNHSSELHNFWLVILLVLLFLCCLPAGG